MSEPLDGSTTIDVPVSAFSTVCPNCTSPTLNFVYYANGGVDSFGTTGSVNASLFVIERVVPQITSFKASPSTITLGQPTTISWTTNGATSTYLCGSMQEGTGGCGGTEPANYSYTLTPTTAGTTDFTLTATGLGGGTSTSKMTLTISPVSSTTPTPSPSATP